MCPSFLEGLGSPKVVPRPQHIQRHSSLRMRSPMQKDSPPQSRGSAGREVGMARGRERGQTDFSSGGTGSRVSFDCCSLYFSLPTAVPWTNSKHDFSRSHMMGWFPGAGGGGDPELELTSSHMRETSGTFPLGVQGEEDTGTLGGGGWVCCRRPGEGPTVSCTHPQRDRARAHGSKFRERLGRL